MIWYVVGDTLTDIANSIRNKAGTTGLIKVEDMDDAIDDIEINTGGAKSGIRHFFDGTNTLYNISQLDGERHFFDGTNTLYNIPVLTGTITEEE